MKKTIRTISKAAVCLLLMSSCHEDFLTEKVYDSLTPLNFYKTEADIKAAVISVYNAAHASDLWGRQAWLAAEYPGEASWPNFSGEAWRSEMDQYNWTPGSTGFRQLWSGYYKMIDRANTVLEFSPTISYANPATKDQVEGEARFLRALAYLSLVRFFDHVPYVTEENRSELYPGNEGTDDQVWQLIIDDLQFATSKLPAKYTGAEVGKATGGAAQALLTKAYLTRAGKPWNKSEYWALAAAEANKIINNSAYGYGLHADYTDVFSIANEHAKEYVFSIEVESGMNLGKDYPTFTGIRSGNQLRLDGWTSIATEVEFFNSMSVDDKRREKTFVLSYPDVRGNGVVYTYPETITLPHFNKFINKDDDKATATSDYATNMIIIRYADVLLMQSEAENEANGPSAEAVKGVNLVRQRAGLPLFKPEDFTKQTLADAILQERIWELCLEGHAYFDLKRQGAIQKRIKKYPTSEKHYVFPIPQTEIDVNPNLKQHPLYN
jgi:hypothetical protein